MQQRTAHRIPGNADPTCRTTLLDVAMRTQSRPWLQSKHGLKAFWQCRTEQAERAAFFETGTACKSSKKDPVLDKPCHSTSWHGRPEEVTTHAAGGTAGAPRRGEAPPRSRRGVLAGANVENMALILPLPLTKRTSKPEHWTLQCDTEHGACQAP